MFWGLSDYSLLNKLHSDFLKLDEKLSVNAMDFETISEHLVSRGIVDTTAQRTLQQCMLFNGFMGMFLT